MRQQNSGVLLPGTKGVERVVGGNEQLSHTVPAELGCCLIKGFLSPWMGVEGGRVDNACTGTKTRKRKRLTGPDRSFGAPVPSFHVELALHVTFFFSGIAFPTSSLVRRPLSMSNLLPSLI